MVTRTPTKLHKKLMVAPLNPTLIRETVNKVDRCMARLQELQYTVSGGNKAVGGVNLSPRSTRGYLKASLRCKQESISLKGDKRSPIGKLQSTATGDWRWTSLPAMLAGETIREILHAGKFAKDFVQAISGHSDHTFIPFDDPQTPVTLHRKQRISDLDTAAGGIESRWKREKKHTMRTESNTPMLQRARSRINFKVPSPKRTELDSNSIRFSANRVSSSNRPWAKKAVLFPNPLFNSSPTTHRQRFCITKEPNHQIGATTPHKFMIKSPPSAKSKFQVRIKNPVVVAKISPPRPAAVNGSNRRASPLKMAVTATAAKMRRSLSSASLASRLMSPLKSRNNSVFLYTGGGCGGAVVSSGGRSTLRKVGRTFRHVNL